jgi:hypothetical protein
MPTLLLSTWSLPAARALGDAAGEAAWNAYSLEETPSPALSGPTVYYGGSDVALDVAARFHLAFLKPPLDLLAQLPSSFRHRVVEFCRFKDLQRLKVPTFVKPADSLSKAFAAGIYSSVGQIRLTRNTKPETPVLVAEPGEWLAEYRCFILEEKVAATSPYLSFGRPVWRPFGQGGEQAQISANVLALCDRLLAEGPAIFPPAFVMDVGLIEDRGWAVVEFNPAWCSGVLGADPKAVLRVLQCACRYADNLSKADRHWLVARKQHVGQ